LSSHIVVRGRLQAPADAARAGTLIPIRASSSAAWSSFQWRCGCAVSHGRPTGPRWSSPNRSRWATSSSLISPPWN